MDSLAFLDRISRAKVQPVYAVTGDDAFLKRHVLAALRGLVLGTADEPAGDELGLATFPGEKATWAAVHDELETLPFLSPRRLVVVEAADPFVSRERARLEKYVAAPSPAGVLVLEVQTWPSNTRLAKLLSGEATLDCKAPPAGQLPEWCRTWCSSRHGKELAADAARLLVDLVGPQMGLLDQELAKLVLYAGNAPRVESADVDTLVGNSRAEKTFKIFDLIGNGQTGEALTLLDRLFEQGEDPFKLLGAFSHHLRGLARAARLSARGTPLSAALAQAGIPPFATRGAEAQMRHLGRRRLDRLFDWLLQVDLGFKGSSQLSPRTILERLVVRLARAPEAAAARSK
jgi:DNA polymerase-3 subunit delta